MVGLLRDAALLFRSGSYATSAFMSIAAIEGSGKSEMGIYTKREPGKRLKNDPLRDHRKKKTVAPLFTVAMGARLIDALGNERIEELYDISLTLER